MYKLFPHSASIVAALALAVGTSALAQAPSSWNFRGVINDFTPASGLNTPGPWEIRGPWSLVVKGSYRTADCRVDLNYGTAGCKADFTAALTMERSDAGVMQNGDNFDDPTERMAHTHHITLVNGKVTTIPGGIEISGPATVTANGAFPPPFGSTIPNLTIDITGSTGPNSVTYSNISVLFGSPASIHFGTAPIHGVVRSSK